MNTSSTGRLLANLACLATGGSEARAATLLDRCTFFNSYAAQGGAAAVRRGQFRGCIMQDGILSSGTASLVLILPWSDPPPYVSVERCDVENGQGGFGGDTNALVWGEGNIDEDPRFDPELRLTESSPCIEQGAPHYALDGEQDLQGAPRYFDSDGDGVARADMGANEFQIVPCPADFDRSGFVDTEDFDAFVRAFEAGC